MSITKTYSLNNERAYRSSATVVEPGGVIDSVTINDGGLNYVADEALTISGGGGTGGSIKVGTVDGNGTILTVVVVDPGTGYDTYDLVSGGSGTGADLVLVTDPVSDGSLEATFTLDVGKHYHHTISIQGATSGTVAITGLTKNGVETAITDGSIDLSTDSRALVVNGSFVQFKFNPDSVTEDYKVVCYGVNP